MARLKCMIVDDEPIAVEGLCRYVAALDFLETAHTCCSAEEAGAVLEREPVDLLFLDIDMPGLSGIEFLERTEQPPMTILTTAYSEYALDGYRLDVVDYLLKPVGFERFEQAARKALARFRPSTLFLRQGNRFLRLSPEGILYAEGMENYVRICCADRTLVVHRTMASLERELPGDAFFRVHRSYLVNLSRIDAVSGGRVRIGGRELPVSPARKEELLRRMVR